MRRTSRAVIASRTSLGPPSPVSSHVARLLFYFAGAWDLLVVYGLKRSFYEALAPPNSFIHVDDLIPNLRALVDQL